MSDPLAGRAACSNIGPAQQRRRVRIGAVLLLFALLGAVSLYALHSERSLRLLVFVPLLCGAISLLQVRARTCVLLAAQGKRDLDHGEELITDAGERAELRRQSLGVLARAGSLAALATAVFWSIP